MKSDFDYDALATAIVDKLAAKVPELVDAVLGKLEQNRQAALDFQNRSTVEAQKRREDAMVRQSIEEHKTAMEDERRARWRAAFPSGPDWPLLTPLEQNRFLDGHEPPADLDDRRKIWLEVRAENPSHLMATAYGLTWFTLNEDEKQAWLSDRKLPNALDLVHRANDAKSKLNIGR